MFPADVVLVAAIAAHGEKSEDGHLADQGEKCAGLVRSQEIVLLVGAELAKAPVMTRYGERQIEFGKSGTRRLQVIAHRTSEGIIKKVDYAGFTGARGIGGRNDARRNRRKVGRFRSAQYKKIASRKFLRDRPVSCNIRHPPIIFMATKLAQARLICVMWTYNEPASSGGLMAQLTTHILDTANGRPAGNVAIRLCALGSGRNQLASAVSNSDGRTDAPLLKGEALRSGEYELEFDVGSYFAATGVATGEPPFLNTVVIRFAMQSGQNYHVPLLVSPWSYSTYRGS